MSTEVTPDLLRTVAAAWEGGTASDDYARHELHQWANSLERPTPGQTLWEAEDSITTRKWVEVDLQLRSRYERIAAVVLAAHGTPTLTDEDRSVVYRKGWDAGCRAGLDPVGEHPEPGTRGLLPVKVNDDNEWNYDETFSYLCDVESELGRTILADPRPDGAPHG